MSPKDPKQTAAVFVDAMIHMTPLRAQALQHLDEAHQAHESALAVEAKRIANRYGADSAQSKEISARIAMHATRGRTIAAERHRAQISVPKAQPDTFIVYGWVLDLSGGPLKSAEIVVAGSGCGSIGSTKSLADGSFLLCVPATPSTPPAPGAHTGYESGAFTAGDQRLRAAKEDTKPAPSNTVDSTGEGQKTAGAGGAHVTSFQLVITDGGKTMTYHYPETFNATAGMLAYREIVMPGRAR